MCTEVTVCQGLYWDWLLMNHAAAAVTQVELFPHYLELSFSPLTQSGRHKVTASIEILPLEFLLQHIYYIYFTVLLFVHSHP